LFILFVIFFFIFSPHGGIFGYTPVQAFHSSHIQSIITKKNRSAYKSHQLKSQSIYANLKEYQKLQIGDRVLLKLKKKAFRKDSSTFYPRYTDNSYKISGVDYSEYPLIYRLSGFPKSRGFYAFELQKVEDDFQEEATIAKKIIVKDVLILRTTPVLRSGHSFKDRVDISYLIDQDGLEQTVGSPELKFFKKVLGERSVEYAPKVTEDDEKRKYII